MFVSRRNSTFFAGYWGHFKPSYQRQILEDFMNYSNEAWGEYDLPISHEDFRKAKNEADMALNYSLEMLKGELSEEDRLWIEDYRKIIMKQYLEFREESQHIWND